MSEVQKRGAFIVFEGIDRCGKTTQSKRLVEHLNSIGLKSVHYRFPDRTTEIGKMINAYLTNKTDADDRVIHLLFSANRWERSDFMCQTLLSGTNLIVDRYSHSGVAFSHAKGLPLDWCYQPEKGLPAPDTVLYLNLPVEVAQQRGNYGDERYEKLELQTKVAKAFQQLKTDTWVDIDATKSPDEMFVRIKELALERIATVQKTNAPIGSLE